MYYSHEFGAAVSKYDFGKYCYTVLYVPEEIIRTLPVDRYPRLRVEIEVDDYPLEVALMPDRIGSNQTTHLIGNAGPLGMRIWYINLSKKVLKEIGKTLDEPVSVRLVVADQDAVRIPESLYDFLTSNPDLMEIWTGLTPGKRRSYAHLIESAKTRQTVERRPAELSSDLAGM